LIDLFLSEAQFGAQIFADFFLLLELSLILPKLLSKLLCKKQGLHIGENPVSKYSKFK